MFFFYFFFFKPWASLCLTILGLFDVFFGFLFLGFCLRQIDETDRPLGRRSFQRNAKQTKNIHSGAPNAETSKKLAVGTGVFLEG